jgi:hypothetical protein
MSTTGFQYWICLALVATGLEACTEDPVVCTAEFRTITVTVIDTAGSPSPNVTLTSVLKRTGETLGPTSLILTPPGIYILVDDGAREKIRNAGDSVRVTAVNGTGPTTAAMYFIDVPGGCHVNKVAGPDTLIVH